jgi:aromatic-L-amino-acid decarboxylase
MDSNSLDYSVEDFLKILTKTNEIVVEQYEKSIVQKGFHNISQKELENWFNEPLPLSGMDGLQLLDEVKEKIVDTATGNLGENMYAYVMAGGNQISTIADFIASTINQNVTKWHLAPAMTEVEKRVIAWTAEMINYAPAAGGALVSGGSAANLAGLTVARNTFFRKLNLNKTGLFGKQPFKVYCSKETHNSIDKSVALLGIGTDNLMRIATNPDYTIDITALENQIVEDIQNGFVPFCIVGNAGTVNTGAIDDLETLANLATKYKTWFHIDGAYGGLASSLPNLKSKYAGIEKADSVALDFHKWLYQPFEIGCVLVKNWDILRETYFKQADYLDTAFEEKSDRLEFNEHYFQLSRNAKALKVWMSLKAYGFSKIQEMIQKDIDLTHYLADLIRKSDDFELKAISDLAIACFVYKGNAASKEKVIELNQTLIPALESDGRVFITGTKLNGEFVLRACLINHRKQKSSVNYLLETIREVGTKLLESQ